MNRSRLIAGMEQNQVPHPFPSWRNGGILMLELNIASNIYRMPRPRL
jgi:hypothetical protein